ncbi:flagellar motor protein MotB, partial [Aequorivita sp. KMM 9714]|nr:flagellar motor protein MotB [Aequorivita sp. KMM 9714]
HPALSPDGKRLYFSSDMPGTLGMSDLWYVDILENGTYGTPVNLGPEINTEGRESFPFVSDKNNLYFSSDGRSGLGGYDVFVS